MKKKVSVSWSGGKDSAFALYKILSSDDMEVVSLHTVFNEESKRVGMHGVNESLIEAQAQALRLPLEKLFLRAAEDHDAYSELMKSYYHRCKSRGIDAIVFGDIFLEDLKIFRDKLLVESGLDGVYPLWKIDSAILINDFINLNFKTIICSANANYFSHDQLGITINADFVNSLANNVDPSGENGEFHTFVYDGPLFRQPIRISKGEKIEQKYKFRVLDDNATEVLVETPFWFQELTLS